MGVRQEQREKQQEQILFEKLHNETLFFAKTYFFFKKKKQSMKPLNVFFFQKMTDEAVIYTEKEQKTIRQN